MNWLLRLIRHVSTALPPIRHLLLMQFLGYTAEAFFALPVDYKPFGDGPWPCLNQASDHFRELRVLECRTKPSHRKGKPPIGFFTCDCGFVYARNGPDRSPEDRYRWDWVEAYGPVWENRFSQLWFDLTVSLKAIARQLQIGDPTVVNFGQRMGLPFPKPGSVMKVRGYRSETQAEKTHRPSQEDIRDRFRDVLKQAMIEDPDVGRNTLRETFYKEFSWLMKYDRDWMEKHLPARKPPTHLWGDRNPPPWRDWKQLDENLSKEVAAAAGELRQSSECPVRITVKAIGKRTGQTDVLQRHLDKLPLTRVVIEAVVETPEDRLLRKIQWLENQYRSEGVCPTWRQFVDRLASRLTLRPGMSRVQGAIDEALASLGRNDR